MVQENEDEILMENVTPEDLPKEGEQTPFVPAPRWRRIFAWVLFAIVLLGLLTWLLNIAFPTWSLGQWLKTVWR